MVHPAVERAVSCKLYFDVPTSNHFTQVIQCVCSVYRSILSKWPWVLKIHGPINGGGDYTETAYIIYTYMRTIGSSNLVANAEIIAYSEYYVTFVFSVICIGLL